MQEFQQAVIAEFARCLHPQILQLMPLHRLDVEILKSQQAAFLERLIPSLYLLINRYSE